MGIPVGLQHRSTMGITQVRVNTARTVPPWLRLEISSQASFTRTTTNEVILMVITSIIITTKMVTRCSSDSIGIKSQLSTT
jgi:hypothetical protein